MRRVVRSKQSNLLQHGVIVLQDNAAAHRHLDVQIRCNVGAEVLIYPPYYPDIAQYDYWLFKRVKENLPVELFKSEDDINIAVTATFHHLSKDEHRAVIHPSPHRLETCMDSAGECTD